MDSTSRPAGTGSAPVPSLTVSLQTALVYYGAVIVVGSIGTALAYSWSKVWIVWSGEYAWARDIIRLTVAVTLSLFGLWALEGVVKEGSGLRLPRLSSLERLVVAGSAVALLLLIPFSLAPSFIEGLPGRDYDMQPENCERANSTQCTYWISVTNLTSDPVKFEGRYDILKW